MLFHGARAGDPRHGTPRSALIRHSWTHLAHARRGDRSPYKLCSSVSIHRTQAVWERVTSSSLSPVRSHRHSWKRQFGFVGAMLVFVGGRNRPGPVKHAATLSLLRSFMVVFAAVLCSQQSPPASKSSHMQDASMALISLLPHVRLSAAPEPEKRHALTWPWTLTPWPFDRPACCSPAARLPLAAQLAATG